MATLPLMRTIGFTLRRTDAIQPANVTGHVASSCHEGREQADAVAPMAREDEQCEVLADRYACVRCDVQLGFTALDVTARQLAHVNDVQAAVWIAIR